MTVKDLILVFIVTHPKMVQGTICNALPENIDRYICDLFPPSKLTSVDLMYNKLTKMPDELSLHEESIANIGLSFNYCKCIPSPVFDSSILYISTLFKTKFPLFQAT